jgi:DNA polymerase III subunit delta
MAKKEAGISEQEIIKDIEKGNFAGIYGLHGEEPYYIDKISDLLEEKALQPHEKDFNLSIFYGKDANWSDVLSACRRYPMFAEKQLVILKEAQMMKDLDKLDVYLENPMPSTIFVIAHKYKAFDGRKATSKLIKKNGILFTSEVVKEYEIKNWISGYLSSKGISADAKVLDVLSTYLGTDLQKIINEIGKVLLNEPQLKNLTTTHIEKYIGISREYNVFELPNTLMKGDAENTFRMVNYFIANPKDSPMVLIVGSLFNNFQKLYNYHFVANKSQGEIAGALKISPYFVKDYQLFARKYPLQKTESALHLIKEYNLKSLGIDNTASQAGLVKELVTRLFYL